MHVTIHAEFKFTVLAHLIEPFHVFECGNVIHATLVKRPESTNFDLVYILDWKNNDPLLT